jgi:ABC-2 type transport system ATP-binding protein
MRTEIAASLIHKPKILFLDEPTIGLDATSKKIVRDFILKINKEQKVTVILTSHDMTDIEALAKRIILIGKGQILYNGTLKKLKKNYGNNQNIKVFTKDKIQKELDKFIIKKSKIENGYNFKIDSNKISVSNFLNQLSLKYNINDIEIDNENIDEIILKLYEDYHI